MFASQAGENRGAFTKEKLKQIAADVRLNADAFNACMDSGKYAALVKTETAALSSFGVESTPTFIVNGRPLAGNLPIETFRQVIDAARLKAR